MLLNQENSFDVLKSEGLIKTVSDGLTAWSFAGKDYNRETTTYFLPPKKLLGGNEIKDFNQLPAGTLVFLPEI